MRASRLARRSRRRELAHGARGAEHGDPLVVRVQEPRSLRGIWGASANDIWAVGDDGLILHGDGTGWTKVPSGTTNDLYAVMGSSATDVYAVGANATILRWKGGPP